MVDYAVFLITDTLDDTFPDTIASMGFVYDETMSASCGGWVLRKMFGANANLAYLKEQLAGESITLDSPPQFIGCTM